MEMLPYICAKEEFNSKLGKMTYCMRASQSCPFHGIKNFVSLRNRKQKMELLCANLIMIFIFVITLPVYLKFLNFIFLVQSLHRAEGDPQVELLCQYPCGPNFTCKIEERKEEKKKSLKNQVYLYFLSRTLFSCSSLYGLP